MADEGDPIVLSQSQGKKPYRIAHSEPTLGGRQVFGPA
jgi:hypothetical protein